MFVVPAQAQAPALTPDPRPAAEGGAAGDRNKSKKSNNNSGSYNKTTGARGPRPLATGFAGSLNSVLSGAICKRDERRG